jgi:hypothetical protein
MSTLREAAQQALELRRLADKFSEGWHDGIKIDATDIMLLAEVAAALEQQEQEPVAWTDRELELIDGMIEVQLRHAAQCDAIANRPMAERQKGWDMERVALLRKIKSSPPRRETEQEPVAWQWLNSAYFRKKPPANAESGAWIPLYTAPPRREWRKLTEEEILLISVECAASHQQDDVAFARAVEAKLKEKNHD